MDRPDFRSKLIRDLIPDPPDYLSAHQKKWDEIYGQQTNLRVGPTTSMSPPQPKAKARAAASFGGGGIRKARSSVNYRCCSWLWKCCGGGLVTFGAVLLLAVYGGAEGPLIQLGRLLGIAADLGEATSLAAGHAVNVTGAIAHAATDVISSATSNGLNSAENIWRGIDISQLTSQRCAGILTVDDEHVLATWLNSSAARVLVPCMNDELREQMLAAASSVSLALTSLQTSTETLELAMAFNLTKVWVQLLPSGRLQVHYDQVMLSYGVCWANPLWTHWQIELGSEQEQILRLLRRAILGLPASSSVAGSSSLELEVKFAWPMLRSRCRVWLRRIWWQTAQLIRSGFVVTWTGMGAVNVASSWFLGWVTLFGLLCLILFVFLIKTFGPKPVFVSGQCIEVRLAILDGLCDADLSPHAPPVPVDVSPSVKSPVVFSPEQSCPSSSDGSFTKVSAVKVSDESEASSEHSYLLPE